MFHIESHNESPLELSKQEHRHDCLRQRRLMAMLIAIKPYQAKEAPQKNENAKDGKK